MYNCTYTIIHLHATLYVCLSNRFQIQDSLLTNCLITNLSRLMRVSLCSTESQVHSSLAKIISFFFFLQLLGSLSRTQQSATYKVTFPLIMCLHTENGIVRKIGLTELIKFQDVYDDNSAPLIVTIHYFV